MPPRKIWFVANLLVLKFRVYKNVMFGECRNGNSCHVLCDLLASSVLCIQATVQLASSETAPSGDHLEKVMQHQMQKRGYGTITAEITTTDNGKSSISVRAPKQAKPDDDDDDWGANVLTSGRGLMASTSSPSSPPPVSKRKGDKSDNKKNVKRGAPTCKGATTSKIRGRGKLNVLKSPKAKSAACTPSSNERKASTAKVAKSTQQRAIHQVMELNVVAASLVETTFNPDVFEATQASKLQAVTGKCEGKFQNDILHSHVHAHNEVPGAEEGSTEDLGQRGLVAWSKMTKSHERLLLQAALLESYQCKDESDITWSASYLTRAYDDCKQAGLAPPLLCISEATRRTAFSHWANGNTSTAIASLDPKASSTSGIGALIDEKEIAQAQIAIGCSLLELGLGEFASGQVLDGHQALNTKLGKACEAMIEVCTDRAFRVGIDASMKCISTRGVPTDHLDSACKLLSSDAHVPPELHKLFLNGVGKRIMVAAKDKIWQRDLDNGLRTEIADVCTKVAKITSEIMHSSTSSLDATLVALSFQGKALSRQGFRVRIALKKASADLSAEAEKEAQVIDIMQDLKRGTQKLLEWKEHSVLLLFAGIGAAPFLFIQKALGGVKVAEGAQAKAFDVLDSKNL